MNEKPFSHLIAEKNFFRLLIKCFVIPGGLGVCKYPLEWKFQGGGGGGGAGGGASKAKSALHGGY